MEIGACPLQLKVNRLSVGIRPAIGHPASMSRSGPPQPAGRRSCTPTAVCRGKGNGFRRRRGASRRVPDPSTGAGSFAPSASGPGQPARAERGPGNPTMAACRPELAPCAAAGERRRACGRARASLHPWGLSGAPTGTPTGKAQARAMAPAVLGAAAGHRAEVLGDPVAGGARRSPSTCEPARRVGRRDSLGEDNSPDPDQGHAERSTPTPRVAHAAASRSARSRTSPGLATVPGSGLRART